MSDSPPRERPAAALNAKFLIDLFWNYGSLAVMAVSGLAINLLLASAAGPRALGVFNQVYAYFVILSQIAVGGVHHSALKHVAQLREEDPGEIPRVGAAALILAAGLGPLTGALLWLGSDLLAAAADSPELGQGLALAAPGLALFSLNKVLLSLLNGLRHMRTFSVLQALRFLALIGAVALVVERGWPIGWLGFGFTAAEGVVFLAAAPLVWRVCPLHKGRGCWSWLRLHASFGARGLFSGLLLESAVRTDVVVLGLFFSDAVVGIYSLAATFAEGFYNLLHMIRLNVNPLLPPLLVQRRLAELGRLIRGLQRIVYPCALAAGLLLCLVYPVLVRWLDPGGDFAASLPILLILVGGLVAYSGVLPLDFILLQGGYPGTHTLFMFLLTATNLLLNLVLIQVLGYLGAAWATAASFVLGIFYLRLLVRVRLGLVLPLWPWRRDRSPGGPLEP